jgi:hypothetical protein
MTEPLVTENNRCSAITKSGQACKAPAVNDSRYCFAHSPDLTSRRNAARKRGGANSSKSVRLQKLVPPRMIPVLGLLQRSLLETYRGELKPNQATAIAALSRALVSVFESGEMEERLRILEEKTEINNEHR